MDNIYEQNIDFSEYSSDIKPIAIYLPQSHEFPENNRWGNNYKEEAGSKKRIPKYTGQHHQKYTCGCYDPDEADTIRKHAKLAKEHGIYAFGIYYYWLSGKSMLRNPLDLLVENKDIDMPFFLILAKENWAGESDGKDADVLTKQENAVEVCDNLIIDLKKYLMDDRYVKIDGKPVIGVYDPREIPNIKETASTWRKIALDIGLGELIIWQCQTGKSSRKLEYDNIFDGEYEFPPRANREEAKSEKVNGGGVFSYRGIIEHSRHIKRKDDEIPFYRGSMTVSCYGYDYSPELFYHWNCINVAYARRTLPKDRRFIFINAWDECSYLEPDKEYGYAAINALSKAIFDLPGNGAPLEYVLTGRGNRDVYKSDLNESKNDGPKIAIQVHAYYIEMMDEIISKLNEMPFAYDLFISTDEKYKKTYIEDKIKERSNAMQCHVDVFDNKGRDVKPFLGQLAPYIEDYDFICHVHTKKSLTDPLIGIVWRKYLFENIIGSRETIEDIFRIFLTNVDAGIIYPQNIDLLKDNWGGNKEIAQNLMDAMGQNVELPDDVCEFPAGDMFWARTKAVKSLFKLDVKSNDFPEEKNQVDATIMHAIERLWIYVSKTEGFDACKVRSYLDDRPLDMIAE